MAKIDRKLFAGFAFALLLACITPAPASASAGNACVPEMKKTPVDIPWSDYQELCGADFGTPWEGGIPPTGPGWINRQEAYAQKVQSFLRDFAYRAESAEGDQGLDWIKDARWRLTGDWAGCPTGKEKWTNQVHPAVRIYYSPEVMEWLCKYRQPGEESPQPDDLPPGAMIVKEMANPDNLAYQPGTGGTVDGKTVLGKLWVTENYDDAVNGWTIMIKGEGSKDGWYWGFFAPKGKADETYNPPLLNRSGYQTAEDPKTGFPLSVDAQGNPLPPDQQVPPPEGPWYPTYWNFSIPDVSFPNYEFGNYCIYCHGSAQSESTFSSLKNVLDQGIEYNYFKDIPTPPGATPGAQAPLDEHLRGSAPSTAVAGDRTPFPSYNPLNREAFESTYPQFEKLSYDEVWTDRLPAQTYDHAVAAFDGPEEFLTSDQCLSCHDAGGAGQRLPNMVVIQDDGDQVNLTEYAEWSASPMGLGGRDPIFYAMLESELNRADHEQGEIEKFIPCIQNTCLHCHGNMGQRQLAIDTRDPADDPCKAVEQTTDPTLSGSQQWTSADQLAAGYGGRPFLRDDLGAWRDENSQNAKYGSLGRDGISCTTCHRMSAEDLGQSGKTFTGNFRVGPTDEIYGPFDKNVQIEPMKNSLGITPMLGEAITKSEMCGSCHAIFLPAFDNDGNLLPREKFSFEQTTYLEWLNSAFNEKNDNVPPSDWRSCQECHMRDQFVYVEEGTGRQERVSLDHQRIANVEDDTFPEAEYSLDLDLEYRDYKRHTLFGLNAFLNAYFQQFPLLLGVRQLDYMDGTPVAPLLTGREEVLLIAREATATVEIGNVGKTAGALNADVTVTNLGGHKLPSGVGFRRAFIEFQILDAGGEPIWASGMTDSVGLIQNFATGETLKSELLEPDPGSPCDSPYQPHYRTITEPCQAQIYEELVLDSAGHFTTSFLHRVTHLKDNRLLPKGYRTMPRDTPPDQQPSYCTPWCAEANPDGKAEEDPDYIGSGTQGVRGEDTVSYQIALSAEQLEQAVSVRATLYSQATAPYFLKQRFDSGKQGPRDRDSKRLYFLSSHLNTAATADDGSAYLDQYKLQIYSVSAAVD